MDAADGRQFERLARVRPVAAARTPFGRAVEQQHAVAKPVLRATEGEVEHVLSATDARAGAPADVEVFHSERCRVATDEIGRRAVRALADRTHLAVPLGAAGHLVHTAQAGFDVALGPVVTE